MSEDAREQRACKVDDNRSLLLEYEVHGEGEEKIRDKLKTLQRE